MPSRPEELFELVHQTVCNTTKNRTRGIYDADKTLEPLLKKLDHMFENHPSIYQQTQTGRAIILATKLLLNKNTKRYEKCSIAKFIIGGLKIVRGPEQMENIPVTYFYPQFMHFSTTDFEGSPSMFLYLEALELTVNIISQSERFMKDFYAPTNLPLISKTLVDLSTIYANRNKAVDLRKKTLVVTLNLVRTCPSQQVDVICTVLPGILSKVFTLIMKDSLENVEILKICLEIFNDLVLKCISDVSFQPGATPPVRQQQQLPERIREMLVDRGSGQWKKHTAEHIKLLTGNICARMAVHPQPDIRFYLLTMLKNFHVQCSGVLKDSLSSTIFDICLHLNRDKIERISNLTNELIMSVNEPFREKQLQRKMDELICEVPANTRKRGTDISMSMLCSVLALTKNTLRVLCASRAPLIQRLARSLIDTVKVDLRRVMITREPNCNLAEYLGKFPLLFNLNHKDIRDICKYLVNSAGLEILDIFYTEMTVAPPSQKCSAALIIAYLLNEYDGRPPVDDTPILIITEYFIECIQEIYDHQIKNDSVIGAGFCRLPDAHTCLESLLCVNLPTLLRFLSNEAQKSKFVIDVLYVLLLECTSIQWTVMDAAELGLNIMAKSIGKRESDALEHYGGYIVHKVSLACSSRTNHHFAAPVFQTFLNRCVSSTFFEPSVHIVEKLLKALDSYGQEHTLAILQSFHAFMTALNRWFPNLKPITVKGEDGEQQETPTPQMIIAEKILSRTKHLLNSPKLPIRVVCVDIMEEGLVTISNYENMLLPMVHQNWQGLMTIVKSREPIATASCVRVVQAMAKYAKGFICQRVFNELWPILKEMATEEMDKGMMAYEETAEFLLVTEILRRFPKIGKLCEMRRSEFEALFMPVLEAAEQKLRCRKILKACTSSRNFIQKDYDE
ncbi:unnamed protein product [Caenorhabditis bovis]|uniref:Uncharacterized protein n=1 Tax=Caenorhabditis bovis TaxID=2654633 RepID=A0A8S1F6H2_9PELO|nr:unnamed protein product [Caenorhabditis bovis]